MQKKDKQQKPITVLGRLKQYFAEFEKLDFISDKKVLNKSMPKNHYVNYYQQYKTKGVENDQVIIYRIQNENFSFGVSVNNIKSKQDAVFKVGCKLFEKLDKENRKGLLVNTEEMNFEQFEEKFIIFVTDLQTLTLREALYKNFSLNIPQNEKIKDLLIDNYALSENREDRLEFVKLVINEKKAINDAEKKNIEENVKKQLKETDIYKEIEDIDQQISSLQKKKHAKNQEYSDIKKHLLSQTNYEQVLLAQFNYEGTLRDIKYNEDLTLQQAEKYLGQTLESLYIERQKQSLLADPVLQKPNENKKPKRI